MIRRYIFLLAAVVMWTMGAYAQSGRLSDRVEWKLDNGVLTISGTGATPGYNTTNLEYLPWQDPRMAEKIVHIVVDEGITEIGSYLFGARKADRRSTYGDASGANSVMGSALFCNVRSVSLPSTLRVIGHHAFARMPLAHIVFPDSLEEICSGAFVNTMLRYVAFPPGLRRVGSEAFSGCSRLRAVDFNDLPLKLTAGLFFDAESLRMLLHTANITSVSSNTFGSTVFDRISEDELLEMFKTDGLEGYLRTNLPGRKHFRGTDSEYEQARRAAVDAYYESEAANATSVFELEEFTLLPYNVENGTCTVLTVHHGALLLPLGPEDYEELRRTWRVARRNIRPVYLPANGRVELQSAVITLGGKELPMSRLL